MYSALTNGNALHRHCESSRFFISFQKHPAAFFRLQAFVSLQSVADKERLVRHMVRNRTRRLVVQGMKQDQLKLVANVGTIVSAAAQDDGAAFSRSSAFPHPSTVPIASAEFP